MAKKSGKGVTVNFEEEIGNYLKQKAFSDALFRPVFNKPNKNVKDACTYILNQVKLTGKQGFTDNEIFGMAVHYYDEDDLKPGTSIKCKVIINREVKLTPKEIQNALEDAKADVTDYEKKKLTETMLEELKIELKSNLTPEEIAKAKELAIADVIQEQRDKMAKKKTVVKKPAPPTPTEAKNNPATLF